MSLLELCGFGRESAARWALKELWGRVKGAAVRWRVLIGACRGKRRGPYQWHLACCSVGGSRTETSNAIPEGLARFRRHCQLKVSSSTCMR
eukprot:5096484-Pleurochrysis_carterae.AAC.1